MPPSLFRVSLLLAVAITAAVAVEAAVLVKRTIDGDTIDVVAADQPAPDALGPPTEKDNVWRIRLVGIDTPESRGNAHGEAMPEGVAAKVFVHDLLPVGTRLTLWSEAQESFPHDATSSHRILAYVIMADGRSVEERVVEAGWSVIWQKYGPPPERFAKALGAAQATAETARAGAWATIPDWMRNKVNERTAPRNRK
jgi:endonuclease YncB( thermonuclease family)